MSITSLGELYDQLEKLHAQELRVKQLEIDLKCASPGWEREMLQGEYDDALQMLKIMRSEEIGP
jgi:hypothetical protein